MSASNRLLVWCSPRQCQRQQTFLRFTGTSLLSQSSLQLQKCTRLLSSSSSSYSRNKNNNNNNNGIALVLGSSGALGSSVARHLSQELNMQVLGVDVVDLPRELTGSYELDGFVQLPRHATLHDLTVQLVRGVHMFLHSEVAKRSTSNDDDDEERPPPPKLQAIICASGGWQGDPPPPEASIPTTTSSCSDEDTSWTTEYDLERGAQSYTQSIQQMIQMNLDPVLAASYVAQHFMAPNGLMVVMGATAALQPTPGMLGYGVSKAASHHVVRTMGALTAQSLEGKAIRQSGAKVRRLLPPAIDTLTVVGILPTTIDTPANRKNDPKANFDLWTKPHDIAVEIGTWLQQPQLRPHSGSLVKVYPARKDDGSGMAVGVGSGCGGACFELVR